MTIYICVYGEYDQEKPRVSKLARTLESAGYNVKWVVSESKPQKNVIAVGAKTKFQYYRAAKKLLLKSAADGDMVLGYMHIGGAVGLSIKKARPGVKFLYDYPDPWVGWYYYKTKTDSLKWKIGRLAFRHLERRMYATADFVITASNEQLTFLRSQHGAKKDSAVILNCPDISVFNTANSNPEIKKRLRLEDKRILIFVGQIVEEYGCDILIEAFAKISQQEKDTRLVLLGPIKKREFGERLRAKIKDLKIEDSIIIHEPVPSREVPHFLNTAVIGFVPFKDRFYNHLGSPNKLFEYMSCGVVPIVSEMKEFRHYIQNGRNGVFVKPENSEELARKTVDTLRNDKLLDHIREYNLKLTRERYNWAIEGKKFLEIVAKVLRD